MRVFAHSNQLTVTGCTAFPGHEKKCFIHRLDRIAKEIKDFIFI